MVYSGWHKTLYGIRKMEAYKMFTSHLNYRIQSNRP